MRTFDNTLAAVLIAALSTAAVSAAPGDPATAPAVPPPAAEPAAAPAPAVPTPAVVPLPRHKPDPLDEAYIPPPRNPAPSASVAPASEGAAAPVVAAAPAARSKPFPRFKPALALTRTAGPFPRPRPAASSDVATAAPPSATAPTGVTSPATAPAPGAPVATADNSCGDACSEVIFRTLGTCLWIQNANPRPVTFSAKVSGRTLTVPLAGADAGKADAHKPFEPKEGLMSPLAEGAYHTRISDPFSPSAPGIAVYRARLGTEQNCIKDRNEIASYTATFAAAPPPASSASQ